ncbi:hypothetical protein QEN19_002204 [Hanseniaspora menglaensis]
MSFDNGLKSYMQAIGQSMNTATGQSLVENMNNEVIDSLSASKRKFNDYSSDSDDDSDNETENGTKKPAKDPRTRSLRHTMTPFLATKGIIAFNMNYNINPNQKWDIKVMLSIFSGSGAIVRIEDIRNSNLIPGDFIIIYLDHIECTRAFELMSMCKNLPFDIRKTIVLESKYPKIPNILFVNYRDGFPKGFNIEICEPMLRDVPFNFNPAVVKQRKTDYKNRYKQDFPDDPKQYSHGRMPHMYIYGISKQQREFNENGGNTVNNRNIINNLNNKNSARFLEEKKRQEQEQLLLEEQARNSFFASNDIQQISRYNLLNKGASTIGNQQQIKSFPDVLLKASESLPAFAKEKFIIKNIAERENPVLEKVEKTLSLFEPPQIIQTISTLKNLIKPLAFNMESRRIVEQQIKDFLTSKEEILHSISQVFYEFGLIDLKNITEMIQSGQVSDKEVVRAAGKVADSPESILDAKLKKLPAQQEEMYRRVLKLSLHEIQQLPQDQQILVNNIRREFL